MNDIIDQVFAKILVFLSTFFLVFLLTYIVLMALDFLPEPIQEESVETVDSETIAATTSLQTRTDGVQIAVAEASERVNESAVSVPAATLPTQIVIEKLNKTIEVLNPTSRAVVDLDAALLDGVVRHPDSADLLQDGNVFILGHSSYLPNVFNKNFQAFNGIQNLVAGDEIEVYSDDAVYVYEVSKVYRAQAKDLTVPIADTGKMLTLATCNSFGEIDDRYIVEAKQVLVQAKEGV